MTSAFTLTLNLSAALSSVWSGFAPIVYIWWVMADFRIRDVLPKRYMKLENTHQHWWSQHLLCFSYFFSSSCYNVSFVQCLSHYISSPSLTETACRSALLPGISCEISFQFCFSSSPKGLAGFLRQSIKSLDGKTRHLFLRKPVACSVFEWFAAACKITFLFLGHSTTTGKTRPAFLQTLFLIPSRIRHVPHNSRSYFNRFKKQRTKVMILNTEWSNHRKTKQSRPFIPACLMLVLKVTGQIIYPQLCPGSMFSMIMQK